jgi:lipoic acid synthetase
MRLPEWVKTGYPSRNIIELKKSLRRKGLHTVCEEARCPNIGKCFSRPTATFMIMGSRCTRNCGFCSVDSAQPGPLDPDEPRQVAMAAREMNLRYVVITSVTRDDLPEGGASHFAETIRAVKEAIPNAKVEVLTPDFQGDIYALEIVLDARPDVFNHNVETVPRLYSTVRPQADYGRSLKVLGTAREIAPGIPTKSGIMLGLGETHEEVTGVLQDLRLAGCRMVTIGQYLRPTKKNLPVVEYIRPERFGELKTLAEAVGFISVASGPLVRSSMNAEEYYTNAL